MVVNVVLDILIENTPPLWMWVILSVVLHFMIVGRNEMQLLGFGLLKFVIGLGLYPFRYSVIIFNNLTNKVVTLFETGDSRRN